MFMQKRLKGFTCFALGAILGMSTFQSAYAAPGTLSRAPLFLSTIVEPNVFFTLDDSGSMDWGPLWDDGVGGVSASGGTGLPVINSRERAYYTSAFSRLYSGRYYLPPSGVAKADVIINGSPNGTGLGQLMDPGGIVDDSIDEYNRGWVIRNHVGNRNYYNPAVDYKPWPGTKADGSAMYGDADPKAVLKDPNVPVSAGGESVDITVPETYTSRTWSISGPDTSFSFTHYVATYYVWPDAEGDGQVDQTDLYKKVEIPVDNPAELQNFANWMQYYRSRINATKAIIGTTINNTDASRMGTAFFNNTIARVDVETMSDPVNKRALLSALYGLVIPARGTPARISARDVGNYFSDVAANGGPILDKADGGECQQNFNILMSDGFWNSSSSPGVGDADGDDNSDFDGGTYADADSNVYNTLADVAMYYYENDLIADTTLQDKVPTQEGIDEADHQHLVTYTIAFGKTGTLDPDVEPDDPGFAGWPNPHNGNEERKIDDMWHAAYNGRGQFLSAGDPEELEESLGTAIADIAQRTATAAAVSINSAQLTTQSVVYLAQFNTNRWQGDLFAYPIADLDTGALAATPQWTAAEVLNNRDIGTDPRLILTQDGSDGVAFDWDNLSTAQRNDLMTSPTGVLEPIDAGKARLAYLQGSRADEGGGYFFRERLSLLADLVNSGPVYVGAPSLNWPDKAPFPTDPGERYSDYKNGAAKTREGIIYAGSNGGMLHGFSETDGREALAYIPHNLFSTGAEEGLHYLTDPNYNHRYYNDLTPSISDIYSPLGTSSTKWQTILISGQRGGGRGIFALNVTDPTTFSEANADDIVLWEFDSTDDPDLGYTYSRPQIALANDGNWVAVFGNGYNDTGDGEAKLFIVKIEAGVDGSWDTGDYIELTTGSGDPSNRNGMGTPALVDVDGNGTVDRVYGGDLFGQLWAFDLSDTSTASWGVAGGTPLFTTINNEPITAKPTTARHPSVASGSANSPNLMVYFGSGQYLVDGDKTTTDNNYFYGVWDKGAASGNITSTSLVEQTYDSSFAPARVLTNNPVNYLGSTPDRGWYISLPDTGERSVTNPVVRGKAVFFNSFVPNSDPCSIGGYGYRFAVDLASGSSPPETTIDSNEDGVVDENDQVTNNSGQVAEVAAIRQEGFLPEPVFIENISYTAEKNAPVVKLKDIPRGRFGWQELIR